MVKLEGLLLLLSLALVLFAFIDCAMRDELQIKKLPKWGWLLIIFFFGAFGSLGYLFVGRDGIRAPRAKKNKPRILPPDDNPDFLRGI